MASRLDRAVWLLLHRSELWEQLGHDAQHLLAEQPSPYADFFTWLERLLHEQGALAFPALIGEMASEAAPEALQALAGRVRQFHEVEIGDEALTELTAILDGLRLQAITDELNLLAETQGLSEAAGARQKALYAQQAELKKRLSRPSGMPP
jgi:DNA primase